MFRRAERSKNGNQTKIGQKRPPGQNHWIRRHVLGGKRRKSRVTENAAAAQIALNAETVERISALAAPGIAKGQTLV
ncbi:MAG: hypothetical protein KJP06_01505 [Deltaproteobacteria bacterium]|nr:hypothetical protein [Deltaproteobacteria bacterium]